MTSISAYSFNFETEVAGLKRLLGERAENILFMDIGFTQDDTPKPFASATIRGENITSAQLRRATNKIKKRYVETDENSAAFHLDDNDHTPHAVFINSNGQSNTVLGKDLKDIAILHSLYHEVGHALMPEGDSVDLLHPYKECVADAFASLCLLQRFGQEAVPFLSQVSWLHAFWALQGITTHLTTMTIDNIVADSKTQDFSKLTTPLMMKLAQKYAKRWTPRAAPLFEAHEFFMGDNEVVKMSELLASTCIYSESHPLAFLVGAKVAQPLLTADGILGDKNLLAFNEQDRRIYNSVIGKRLANLRLTGVFNGRTSRNIIAPERLAETLKVTLTPGKKHLTFSFGG